MDVSNLARFDFEKIKKSLAEIGKGNARLTQSALVLIQDINSTKTVYNFPVLENDNATGIKPQEIRLNQNDSFVSTSLGIYLLAKQFDRETEQVKGDYIYLTHAPYNQSEETLDCQPLYDGYLRVSINNINYVDKYDVRKHELVQKTQFNDRGTVNLTGSTYANIDLNTDGIFSIAPMITLEGSKKNQIDIVLPYAMTSGKTFGVLDNNGNQAFYQITSIGLVWRGLLAQNSSQFQTRSK
jgi:hypothetical protein